MFKRSFVVRALVCILLHSSLEQRKAEATDTPPTPPESTSPATVQPTTAPTTPTPTTTKQTIEEQSSTTEIKTTHSSSTTIQTTSVLPTTIMQTSSLPIETNQTIITTTTTPSSTVIQTTTPPKTENASAAATLTNVIHNEGITTEATGVSTTAKTSSGDGATSSQSSTLQSTDNSSTVTVSSSSSLSTGISTVLSSSLTTNITTATTTTTPPPPPTTTTTPTTANTSTATIIDSTTINPSSSLPSTNSNATAHVTDATATDNVTTASTLVSTTNISTETTAPSTNSNNTTVTPTTVVITSSLNQSETTHSASSNSAVTNTNTVTVANGSTPTTTETTVTLENSTQPSDTSTTSSTTSTSTTTTVTPDPCNDLPCVNGSCNKFPNGTAHCICTPGFSGDNCSIDIDDCLNSSCKHGNCLDSINNYTCQCEAGYDGFYCHNDINDCLNSSCKHGNCSDGINNYTCQCEAGYDGFYCQNDINDCLNSSCVHGNCSDGINNYTCQCEAGYEGFYCQNDIDDCKSFPCEHGTCIDGVNNFRCDCEAGFTSPNCSINIDDCEINPCVNGTCQDGINNYTCKCDTGFTGRNCSEDLDECQSGSHDCDRNANCTNVFGSFNCTCWSGLRGDGKKGNCKDIDECKEQPGLCVHGDCFNTPGSVSCICSRGWEGPLCEKDIDECSKDSLNSCDKTNGDCLNTNGSYSCSCKEYSRPSRNDSKKCIPNVLLDIHSDQHQTGDDDVLGPYIIPGGIFYYGKSYNSFYVSMNGYITLGNYLNKRYPPKSQEEWKQQEFPVIAPLWADIVTNGSGAGVYVSFSLNETELGNINRAMGITGHASTGIAITWRKAVPYPYDQTANYEEADFQVILSSNGTKTYIMFNFDQEIFTWKKSSEKLVAIGYSNNSGYAVYYTRDFTNANSNSNGSGVKGRWIFDVTLESKEWEAESQCIRIAKNDTFRNNINEILKKSEACPCSKMQAERDMRYQYKESDGTVEKYSTRFSYGPHNQRQKCHYKAGGLVRGYPDGGFLSFDDYPDAQKAHELCCVHSKRSCHLFYDINPSDSCSRYRAPSWSLSWGDPHLTTLDGANYTFNGRGEYTLFFINKTATIDKLNVQVRTERARNGSNDATVYVGLAAQEGDGPVVEVLLDTSSNTSKIYINRTENVTVPGGDSNITLDRVHIHTSKSVITMNYRLGVSIQISVSNILDITVSAPKTGDFVGNTLGLLGNNNNDTSDDFRLKNNTVLPFDSNETVLFSFGSSWRIESKDESLFKYYEIEKDFAFYNNDSVTPRFFGDMNITQYMIENCNASINVSFCNDDKSCIFDTAATCNANLGEKSKTSNQEATEYRTKIEHMPPSLNFNDPLYLGVDVNRTVDIEIHDNDVTITCNASGLQNVVNNKNYCNGTVSRDQRNTILSLSVTATDKLGATAVYSPSIYFCGCEQSQQCDFSQILNDGPVSGSEKFYRARCNCSENYKGDFCEKDISICDKTACYGNVSCNASITSGNPCGDCPKGLEGNGLKCYDIDECLTKRSNCSQECTNNVGSYSCSCRSGYDLSKDGFSCFDINECDQNQTICGEGRYCNNTEGGYICNCRPGYVFNEQTSTCINVKVNQATYGGFLMFSATENTATESNIFLLLDIIYNRTKIISVDYIEVDKITLVQNSRQRRQASKEIVLANYKCDYLLHLKSKTSTGVLTGLFVDAFKDVASENGLVVPPGFTVPFLLSITGSSIYNETNGGLCNIDGATTCDMLSTNCTATNGSYKCSCKQGFYEWENPGTSCKDFDECKGGDPVCSGGICTNTPGSFICQCPNGFMYDRDSKTCKDLCAKNPCNNGGICQHGNMEGQYVCKCDDKWTGPYCDDENAEAQKLKTIAIAVGASIGSVCFILIFALLGMYRRYKNRYSGYSRRPLSAYDFDSTMNFGQTELRTKDFPIDDENSTSFSIPRPKVKEIGLAENETTHDSAVGETGKMEDPKQPLTKTTEKIPADGKENPSFLHNPALEGDRRSAKRQSKNPYEYF